MKKSWFLVLLPAVLLSAGCSFVKNNKVVPVINTQIAQGNVCAIPNVSSSTEVNAKTGLPSVSQEEKNKTFTYEDTEFGVKMKYPGSCYFNKGIFQCSDFTLSIWLLEDGSPVSATPEKTFSKEQTQIKYTYSHNNKIYALMAWYDGEDKSDLDKVIDNIAKSLTFSK
jgi:hypothetical protein